VALEVPLAVLAEEVLEQAPTEVAEEEVTRVEMAGGSLAGEVHTPQDFPT